METETSLQEQFVKSKGLPILIRGEKVVQQDLIDLPEVSLIEVRFLGEHFFKDNGVALAIRTPGSIHLSDGRNVTAVKIWDEQGLSRFVKHIVDAKGQSLRVYNKYKVKHQSGEATEDSFTGNAGMVVTEVGANRRRYECSSGPGAFSKSDLVFEIQWKPFSN